jgi:hypothetical protein
MRRICFHDMTDDQPVKQHAQRRQMLLDCRLGELLQQYLDISLDVQRLHLGQLAQSSVLAPVRKPAWGLLISPPRVFVGDIRGEEIIESFRRFCMPQEQHRLRFGQNSQAACRVYWFCHLRANRWTHPDSPP